VEKLTRSAVARHLSVHRNTVREALKSPNGPPKSIPRRVSAPSKLDAFKPHILERLSVHPTLPGTTLFEDIKGRGYIGGLAILWDYLKTIRPGTPRAFLRLETLPGEFAQVDWANCGTIQIGNAKRLLSCFVMVLSYSRMMYLEFTLSQCLEDFLSCHVNAFDFFGGIPAKINYDNLKTVVLSRVGKDIRFNPAFHAFAGFYVFEAIPCNVRAGWEKGKVESGIKYIRSSFLAGRDIHSFAQLQKESVLWRDTQANVRIHGATHERPIDRFELEKTKLHPLNSPEFDTAIHRHVTATSQALVMFETNRYSAPFLFARKDLTLAATTHEVEIFDAAGRSVATHVRCYERYRVLENPAHCEGLLAERKKGRATKRVEAFLALAPECSDYLQGLVHAELHVPSHLDKITDLIHRYGKAEVGSAVLRALGFKAFGAHYIERIVHQTRAARDMKDPAPIELTKRPEWNHLAVEQTDLSLYDDLFEGEAHD
jgi:transposase